MPGKMAKDGLEGNPSRKIQFGCLYLARIIATHMWER